MWSEGGAHVHRGHRDGVCVRARVWHAQMLLTPGAYEEGPRDADERHHVLAAELSDAPCDVATHLLRRAPLLPAERSDAPDRCLERLAHPREQRRRRVDRLLVEIDEHPLKRDLAYRHTAAG